MRRILLSIISVILSLSLTACMMGHTSQLEQGKKDLEDKNYRTALNKLTPLASDGNADAQYAVGYMYFYGLGTVKNKYRAVKWIRKAASQGQPDAVKALDMIVEQNAVHVPLAAVQPSGEIEIKG